MALERITPRVFVETSNLGSNNSLIVGSEGNILVDSPHRPTDAIKLAREAQEHGRLRFVVNTDHHPDHTIGNYWMPGEIVSHAGTRKRLLEEAPSDEYLQNLMERIDPEALPLMGDYKVRIPDVVFRNEMTLHVGDISLELTFQPGHTANSLLAYCPQERVLFSGDIFCEAGLPSFQDSRVADWFSALEAVEAFDFEILVPGHGDVADRSAIERYRSQGREVVQKVAAAIAAGHDCDQAMDEIRFEDRIHVDTDQYIGYPDDLIEMFQRRSVSRIYEDLVANPKLVDR